MSSNVRCTVKLPLQGANKCMGVGDEMSRFPLWFNRDTNGKLVAPDTLSPYIKGRRYLSTKQVPSCLMLRFAGSSSVRTNRDALLRSGFTLTEEVTKESGTSFRDLTMSKAANRPQYSQSLSSMLIEAAEINDLQNQPGAEGLISDEESSGSEKEFSEADYEVAPGKSILMRKSRIKVRYDDPWKIQAAVAYNAAVDKHDLDVIVWSGDGIRLQDPLPPRLFGTLWKGSAKNHTRFSAIADVDVKLHIIYAHTHWGRALRVMCNAESDPRTGWARTLRSRVNRLLRGGHDPCMSKAQIEEVFEDPNQEKSKKARSERLIELLKTVDGIFVQRYLAYPEEVWTWERFDVFTLGNIANLIGDEFLDGTLTEVGSTIDSAYSQLKRMRKWFKETSHREMDLKTSGAYETVIPWCRQFVNVWKRSQLAEGNRHEYIMGILSQTRGAGTPPPIVLLQSKVKFLTTVTTVPPQLTPTKRSLIEAALGEVLEALPQEAFTGLATKSRVTVATSSCWEKTRREGGTIEQVRAILASIENYDGVPIRDLDTGRIEKYRLPSDFDSTGELIFWVCLDQVLRTPLQDLKTAFLTMVKEPGKARSVTKARTCLKVVLDLVNKICSEPLKKGIKSSTSGMGSSNHGWNLFLRLHSQELEDLVFSLESREETAYEGYVERTDTFEPLYAVSTDFSEATDLELHEVAEILGGGWMRKCGIPPLLQGIVHATCFKPRNVFFHATGVLKGIGTKAPQHGENIHFVTLVRGVLMGDPLTKIVLHLTNVVARHIGSRLHDADFYDNFLNPSEAREAFLRGLSREPA